MAERPAPFATNLAALKGELWDSVVFKLANGQQVFDGIRGERTVWSGQYLGSPTPRRRRCGKRCCGSIRRTRSTRCCATRWSHAPPRRTASARRTTTAARWRRSGSTSRKPSAPQPKTSISIAGVGEAALDETKKAVRRTTAQEQPLVVTVAGGPIGTRLQMKYLPLAPGDKAEARKEGLIVSRSMTWLHSDGSPATHHDDTAGATFKVPQGEVLEIHTQLVSDEPRNHVALVVPIAAGFEPLNPSLETSGSDAKPSQADSVNATYVQRLDHEVRYYFTELPRGTYTFHFRVRASNEGSFVHPSPWAELMYREEVRGRGAGHARRRHRQPRAVRPDQASASPFKGEQEGWVSWTQPIPTPALPLKGRELRASPCASRRSACGTRVDSLGSCASTGYWAEHPALLAFVLAQV